MGQVIHVDFAMRHNKRTMTDIEKLLAIANLQIFIAMFKAERLAEERDEIDEVLESLEVLQ